MSGIVLTSYANPDLPRGRMTIPGASARLSGDTVFVLLPGMARERVLLRREDARTRVEVPAHIRRKNPMMPAYANVQFWKMPRFIARKLGVPRDFDHRFTGFRVF